MQAEIRGYLQDLLDAGVAGFRVDGAKHMAAGDLQAIFGGLKGDFYVFREVIDQSSAEPVRDWEYATDSDVTEFAYAFALGAAFDDACGGSLSDLETRFSQPDMLPAYLAQVFTDNHDNQRGHGAGAGCITDHRDGQAHVLANVFALAYPYGYPSVMSSYYWQQNPKDNTGDSMGPPSSNDGGATWGVGLGAETRPVYGTNQVAGDAPTNCSATFENGKWACEHRRTATANMVAFRRRPRARVSPTGKTSAEHPQTTSPSGWGARASSPSTAPPARPPTRLTPPLCRTGSIATSSTTISAPRRRSAPSPVERKTRRPMA